MIDKIKNFVLSRYEKKLVVIYLLAIGVSILMFCFCPRIDYPDTATYLFAKEQLLQYLKLDAYRPPLYPLFLAITCNPTLTILVQNIIFLLSVGFFYSVMKMLSFRSRLIFLFTLIYVIHPAFIFYNYQLLTESLSISLSTVYLYYLIRYILYGKTKDCWFFHILIVILILIKPFFTFLLGISGVLFIYQIFFKWNVRQLGLFLLPLVFSFSLIGGLYGMMMKGEQGVWGVSSVTDINLYWIMSEQNMVDYQLIENEELKSLVQAHPFEYYYPEALYICENYGWKELHSVVQASMNKNYKSFFTGKDIMKFRLNNFKEVVGGGSIGDFWKVVSFLCSITFFQLITILGVYSLLIIYFVFKTRRIPVISVVFFGYIAINLFVLFFLTYNDCSRLAVPALSVSLLVIAQLTECVIQIIRNGKFEIKSLRILQ